MRFGLVVTLVVAAVAPLWAASVAPSTSMTTAGPITDAYSPIPLTPDLSTLLYSSLANQTSYASSVTALVCIKSIATVEFQVVAGKNFRFTTTACDVRETLQQQPTQELASYATYLGQCQPTFGRTCVEVNAVVVIYRRYDDKVIQVSRIDTTVKPLGPGTVRAA